jgi:hypothetical protein
MHYKSTEIAKIPKHSRNVLSAAVVWYLHPSIGSQSFWDNLPSQDYFQSVQLNLSKEGNWKAVYGMNRNDDGTKIDYFFLAPNRWRFIHSLFFDSNGFGMWPTMPQNSGQPWSTKPMTADFGKCKATTQTPRRRDGLLFGRSNKTVLKSDTVRLA